MLSACDVARRYNTMARDDNSESILISGESGAGKTEAMKICLTYISQVSERTRSHTECDLPSEVANCGCQCARWAWLSRSEHGGGPPACPSAAASRRFA